MAGLDEQLLDAGRRAFGRFGYHGATTERIAEEAGLSRVTLHRRGVSKELILEALSERAVHAYRAALWPALTTSGTGRERLEQALHALCQVAEEHLELLLALQAQSDRIFHEDAEQEASTRSVFTEPLERLLRDGADDGSLRPVDAQETATVVFNLVGLTYMHLRSGHRWSPERSRGVIAIVLEGVAGGD
ncbi:MAG: TetR/AcrR family transcriptional regulator [Solirubrobacteraceae bacterium]